MVKVLPFVVGVVRGCLLLFKITNRIDIDLAWTNDESVS